jgi:hypothetical protein
MSIATSQKLLSKLATLALFMCTASFAQTAKAQPEPAFIYESLLNTYFDNESGLISFTEYDLAFMPEGKLNASVAVVNSENTVVKSFPFFEEYRYIEGVFGKAQVKGPADVTLTEPGVYNIVFIIDGNPVSRLPVILEQTSEGDDPFDPVKKYRYRGLWQVYGYLTMNEFKEEIHPTLTFWVGMQDLAEGETKDMFTATLKRGEEVIGHSKETLGYISNEHYKRVDIDIFKPHERRGIPNAQFVTLDEWTKPGEYTLEITRNSDNQLIRKFHFTSEEDKIQPLANSAMDFDPHIDYIVPRVTNRSTQNYDFEESIWVKSE